MRHHLVDEILARLGHEDGLGELRLAKTAESTRREAARRPRGRDRLPPFAQGIYILLFHNLERHHALARHLGDDLHHLAQLEFKQSFLLPVKLFDNEEYPLRFDNPGPSGLSASVRLRNLEHLEQLLRRFSLATAMENRLILYPVEILHLDLTIKCA